MTDDRIDFSPLDPTRDTERFDGIVRTIMEVTGPGLAARRSRASVFGQVGLWWRPLLAAAAITGIVALAALARLEDSAQTAAAPTGLAEALGVPEPIAEWVRSDQVPTPAELLIGLEGES